MAKALRLLLIALLLIGPPAPVVQAANVLAGAVKAVQPGIVGPVGVPGMRAAQSVLQPAGNLTLDMGTLPGVVHIVPGVLNPSLAVNTASPQTAQAAQGVVVKTEQKGEPAQGVVVKTEQKGEPAQGVVVKTEQKSEPVLAKKPATVAKRIKGIAQKAATITAGLTQGGANESSYGVGHQLQDLLTGGLSRKRSDSPLSVLADAGRSNGIAGLEPSSFRDSENPLQIVMTAGEAYPFVKTGGLADVVDDVSRGLAARGHHVTVILPKYGDIDEKKFGMKEIPGAFDVPIGGRVETTRLFRAEHAGVEVLFVENEELFGRFGAYGHRGYDYSDNDERFIFHSRAAIEAMRFLKKPVDVFHVHDWQAGLIPAYLKLLYKDDPLFAHTRSVMTIHNIAYQGFYPKESLVKAGFSLQDFVLEKLEYYGHFSFLKAGLAFADAITTVSPTYAEEIKTEEFGHGLDGLLTTRKKDLVGILNGIDLDVNDPRTDQVLHERYGWEDVAAGKARNKAFLQAAAGFRVDPTIPLFGVASRLAGQKGIDLIAKTIDKVVEMGAQLYIIGSGERELEEAIDELAARYPENIYRHGFDTVFVKMVYAASDFLLMPSRFEPCGLSQQIAQRYGTLPIATKTGGLADTITDIRTDPARGDGFFIKDMTVEALTETVSAAVAHFRSPSALAQSRKVAMRKNFSWESSLNRYVELYRKVLEPQRDMRPSVNKKSRLIEIRMDVLKGIQGAFRESLTRPNKQDYIYLGTKTFGINLAIRLFFVVQGVMSGGLPLLRGILSTVWYQVQDAVFTVFGQTYMKFLDKMTGFLTIKGVKVGDFAFIYTQLVLFEFVNRLLLGPLGANPLVYTWAGIGLIFFNILQGMIAGGPLIPAINKMHQAGVIKHSTMMHLYQISSLAMHLGLLATFGFQSLFTILASALTLVSWGLYLYFSIFHKPPPGAKPV